MKNKDTLYKRIRKPLAVSAAKMLHSVCRILHSGGTTVPGIAAGIIDPELLSELASEVRVLVITGTNGKTTAVHMAAHALHSLQIPCAYTRAGENMESSILTVLIDNYDRKEKRPRKETAVLECDEKYAVKLLKALQPVCVTVTNICEDQTDRLGRPEDVAEMFCQGLSAYPGIICLNAGDPYSARLAEKLQSRGILQYAGGENEIVIQGKSYPVKLGIPGKYNVSNAAAAMASLYAAGFPVEAAVDSLQSVQPVFGRMESIRIGTAPVILNLSKNPSGVLESLRYIAEELQTARVVLGFNNDSGDGKDLRWLGSIPWKDYAQHFSEVMVFTDLCDETEKLLRSLDISFRSVNNGKQLIRMIKESSEPVCMILNYTCMMKVRKEMARQNYVPDFWESQDFDNLNQLL